MLILDNGRKGNELVQKESSVKDWLVVAADGLQRLNAGPDIAAEPVPWQACHLHSEQRKEGIHNGRITFL
jgi:hypothetical protein